MCNKTVIRDVWNARNPEAFEGLLTDDYVRHDPTVPGDIHGVEEEKRFAATYLTAFSDVHFEVDDEIAERDQLVTRWTATGRHTGELLGIAPTGRSVTITGMAVARFRDGKICECWEMWDSLGLLQQLGVVPAFQTLGSDR